MCVYASLFFVSPRAARSISDLNCNVTHFGFAVTVKEVIKTELRIFGRAARGVRLGIGKTKDLMRMGVDCKIALQYFCFVLELTHLRILR